MFSQPEIESLLFFDVETATDAPDFDSLPERMKKHWLKREERLKKYGDYPEDEPGSLYTQQGGIPAEFARVVCVSFGAIKFKGDEAAAAIKSFYGTDEKQILTDFHASLHKFFDRKPPYGAQFRLCGHNVKEFDVPFLARRSLIHGLLPLPSPLQMYGKKPWEVPHLDTMELWKFGDAKSFTSLDLLTALLNVPSPKDELDGSMVGKTFWEDKDPEKIARYCEQDVLAVMQVVLRFAGLPLLKQWAGAFIANE